MIRSTRAARLQAALIAGVILLITALHFATPLDRLTLHEIYQRLYYIPILAAAVLFGVRGGLGAALFTSLVYLPHITTHWQHHDPSYALNQYAEIVIFNLVGVVTGIVGDASRRARARTERTAAELQKAYAELRQTYEQLLQADRLTSLGELSSAVVHEVRNPLASIKGAIEILEDELASDSPRREFADIAKHEVERLNNLVGEFLRFARPVKPQVAPADLNELVRSVVALTEQTAQRQNVRVVLDPAPDLSPIHIDAEQIRQVLLNLVINALQAMPDGGALLLRTHAEADHVIVEVEDEGGGVAPDVAPRVFDPFFTTKEKGVGLGLSIAYKIAMQHDGSLQVGNGKRGAIFRVILPADRKGAHARPRADAARA